MDTLDTFARNASRYREKHRHAVGGVYGEQDARILGWSPPVLLELFSDGLGLDSANPNTNQYHAAPTWQDVKVEHYWNGASWRYWKAVLKFARPLTSFAAWSARSSGEAKIITNDVPGWIGINCYLDATFRYYLVTESLDDLTKLTWNSPPSVEAGGAALTKFELDLTQGGCIELITENDYCPGDTADFQFGTMRIGASQTKASSGPYYGILIEIDEPDIFALSDPPADPAEVLARLAFANTRESEEARNRGRMFLA